MSMDKAGTVSVLRGVAAVALIASLSWPVGALTIEPITNLATAGGGVGGVGFDTGLITVCACGLLACWAWFALTTILLIISTLRGVHPLAGGCVTKLSPEALQRLVAIVCGITLSTSLAAATAVADPADAPRGTVPADALRGLVLPDRTTGPSPVPSHTRQITVAPGDSMWSIARRGLPSTATDGAIAVAWRALCRVNATRIGADPDLIFPGTRLTVPPAAHHHRKDAP